MAVTKIEILRNQIVETRTGLTGYKEFIVHFDSQDESNVNDARTAQDGPTEIPAINDSFSDDMPGLICTDITTGSTDRLQIAIQVSCNFSTAEQPTGSPDPDDPAPLPTTVSRGAIQSSEPAYKDRDGNAIRNSARQIYDPALEKKVSDPTVVIKRRILGSDYDWTTTVNYTESINQDQFTLRGEIVFVKQAYIESIVDEETLVSGVKYIDQTITILLREDGWDPRPVDQGTMELDGEKQYVIKDKDNIPITGPVNLDGAGHRSAGGAQVLLPPVGLYKLRTFANLNLPKEAWE